MQPREQLEKRVAELERQLAALGTGRHMRAVRKRAEFEIVNLPLYDIAVGPDPARGETRGHAKGIVAIGDIATGVLALGGFARGLVAMGGLAIGGIALGGLSIGGLAMGGAAAGALAIGGAAAGWVAVGGGGVGEYVCAAGGAGEHVASANRRDAEAVAFFDEHGLGCGPRGRYRR